ncbi:MAG: DNA-3-methyladenine glycosylase I [Bacteroidota bacterium]
MQKNRCGWVSSEQIYIDYHDNEWGKPCHDDQKLFEMLLLEGFQAGLSWITVLRKRESYREALDNFDANICAQYDERKIAELLQNVGLIRNRLKMDAIVANAKAFLEVQAEFGSFNQYIWSFVNHQTIKSHFTDYRVAPTTTPESDAMSKALKKRGFKFIGSTICLAYMQATGMVNDHSVGCFCY